MADSLNSRLVGRSALFTREISGTAASRREGPNYETTRGHLTAHFGNDRTLSTITPGDADQWREALIASGLSAATVSREVKRARQFFRAAVRRKIIPENPFADVSAPAQVNSSRDYFVARDVITKVIDTCPDAEWRLIVALSRYGGLRCPSEHLSLRWADVDWAAARIRVRSPKTEHHAGGDCRVIPLFPELRPYLKAVWEQAEPGTEHVITRYRGKNSNLRTQLLRIIRRAGAQPWPKLFHNLRASRETELTEQYPLHVVCAWIGNSQQIAAKHYLQVTGEHYEKAAQNAAQYASESGRTERESQTETPVIPEEYGGLPYYTFDQAPPRGVEPLSSD